MRYFNSSPEVIRLTVMMYIRYPLSLRQVENLLHERGIDIRRETPRVWWNRFGPMFAAKIRKQRSASLRAHIRWRWHWDEVFLRSPATLQKFAAVHASVHNRFDQERHLYSRNNFKLNRSAARAEWRELSAA